MNLHIANYLIFSYSRLTFVIAKDQHYKYVLIGYIKYVAKKRNVTKLLYIKGVLFLSIDTETI